MAQFAASPAPWSLYPVERPAFFHSQAQRGWRAGPAARARDQARKNADRRMVVRTRRYKATARNRVRRRQEADKLVLRAGHNKLARRGREYKGRKVPDRQRCGWRRGLRRNGHPRLPAWGCRDNRARARHKLCPRAVAAPAVGNRPLLACAGSHRAAQNRAAVSAATVKGSVKTGQNWRQRTARKMRTRLRIVAARSIPSPVALCATAKMSLKLGRPLGASLGAPQIWRRGPQSGRRLPQR